MRKKHQPPKLIKGRSTPETQLESYRNEALKACRDFYYPDDIRDRVLSGKSITEISRAMATARKLYL